LPHRSPRSAKGRNVHGAGRISRSEAAGENCLHLVMDQTQSRRAPTQLHPASPETQVTVEFFARGNSTEVVLTHAIFHTHPGSRRSYLGREWVPRRPRANAAQNERSMLRVNSLPRDSFGVHLCVTPSSSSFSLHFAKPKSRTFTKPSGVTTMFELFRSR